MSFPSLLDMYSNDNFVTCERKLYITPFVLNTNMHSQLGYTTSQLLLPCIHKQHLLRIPNLFAQL